VVDNGATVHGLPHGWLRRGGAWVLLIVGCLFAVLSIFVVWVRYEILDTDTYVATIAPLAVHPEIQQAVATKVSDAVTARTDISQTIHNALPPRAQFLAAPASEALKTLVHQTTLRVVESRAFQQTWTTVNRKAHEQVVILLTGRQGHAISSTANGQVVLDLAPVAKKVEQRLDAQGITVFDKALNKVHGPQFVLFESKQLAQIQGLVDTLNHLAFGLPIVGFLLLGSSLLLAPGRRRGVLRLGLALAITMGLVSVVLHVVRHLLLSGQPAGTAGARGAVFDIFLNIPEAVIRSLLVASLLLAGGAVLWGSRRLRWPAEPGPVRRWFSRWWAVVEGGVVVIGVLVVSFWSNPGPGALIVVGALTVALLAVVAVLGRTGRLSSGAVLPHEPGEGGAGNGAATSAEPGAPTEDAVREGEAVRR
jgi:hypothetical protein